MKAPARPGNDITSVLAKRRSPRVFVIDSSGEILMQSAESTALSVETQEIVSHLVGRHPGEDVVHGLSSAGELIRIVLLSGAGAPHYALFVEPPGRRSPVDDAVRRFVLSGRERDVLELLVQGLSTSEIKNRLFIAESTVATHVRSIGMKMNATKRKEIVATVLEGR